MPTFSPLARGFGTWTGELHLDEAKKVAEGPTLPSLLPGGEHCHGVTIRAKSAVSGFRPTGDGFHSERQGAIPKTYLTRKGAIVLFAAPDDPHDIEMSERDRHYLRKAKRKLLKHRYAEYSNKIGSIHRLAQSVLCFGDEDYPKEEASVSDEDAKAYLKFLRSSQDDQFSMIERKTRPGFNFDMYFDNFMSRCGSALSRPHTAPHSSMDTGRDSLDGGAESAMSMGSMDDGGDRISADSDNLVKGYAQPTPPPSAGVTYDGRASPSSRIKRRMNAEHLTSSLKSGGYLGRQTIIEETPLHRSESEARSRKSSTVGSRKSSQRSFTSPHGSGEYAHSQHPSGPMGGTDVIETDRQFVLEDEYVNQDYDDDIYDDEVEQEGYDQSAGGLTQPLMPMYNGMISPGLLSTGSGGMFSFAASQAHTVDDSVSMQQESAAPSVKSAHSGGQAWEPEASVRDSPIPTEVNAEGQAEMTDDEAVRPKSQESYKSSKSARSSRLSEQREGVAEATDEATDADPEACIEGAEEGAGDTREIQEPEVAEESIAAEEEVIERPHSQASSHSGVPSVAGDEEEEHQQSQHDDLETNEIEITEEISESDPAAQEQTTEQGVTDVSITPKTRSATSRPISAAVSQKPNVEEVKPEQKHVSAPKTSLAPVSTKKAENQKASPPKAAETKATLAPKPTQPKEVSQPKPPTQPKAQSKPPPKEEPKKKDASKPVEKKPPTPPTAKTSTPPNKKEEKEKEKKVDVKAVKDVKKPEPKASPTPAKKTFTKAFDITAYDKKDEKPEPKADPVIRPKAAEEPSKPKPPPQEIKNKSRPGKSIPIIKRFDEDDAPFLPPEEPESLVSDTKAELQRLFGSNVPKAPEKKKEPPKKKRVVIKPPPGPPPKSKEEKELDKLEEEVLGGACLAQELAEGAEDGGGLTAEEMALEAELLKEKLQAAENKILGTETPATPKAKTPRTPREAKKKGKEDKQMEIEKKREALKEAKRLEKQKRLEEAKRIEAEMKANEEIKRQELEKQEKEKKNLESEIEDMKHQAEQAELAEEEARAALLEMRRQAREEREARRKEEQERRKQEALQKKEEERLRREAARSREREMLMRIASQEEKMKLNEEERRRREEEEEQAMYEDEAIEFKFMEQERLEKKRIEEEEAKIAEMEREIEEQALAKLIQERDAALIKKRQMEEQAREMAEEEERLRLKWEEEQKRRAEEQARREEQEERRREAERIRLQELQRMEEEARERMKMELQRRREMLLRRRDQNLERRHHLEGLKTRQGMTKPWVFTYYVTWPRETYEKKMGGDDPKKKGRGKKAGKKKK